MSEGILAIRLRALGDVVLTTPALRALHRGHPDRPLDVVTADRYAGLLEGQPGIDRVIPLASDRGAMLRAIGEIRRRRYHAAVDFFGTPRSAVLTALSGARETYGYDVRMRRHAYRRRVPRDLGGAEGRNEYAAASHLRLAVAAGGVADGEEARLVVSDASREQASRLLAEADLGRPEEALGLVAAGSWATKTWPASHAAWLARRLGEAGIEVLLLAGPGEERVTVTLRRLAPEIRVLPPCDVPVLAAVVERLGGVVGTDSGPRHLAAALRRPTFAWFGPTRPANWTPPGAAHATWWTDAPCRGCNRTACPHWVCLPGLHPERALAEVRAHFGRHGLASSDLGPAARA